MVPGGYRGWMDPGLIPGDANQKLRSARSRGETAASSGIIHSVQIGGGD